MNDDEAEECRCGPEYNPRCPTHGLKPIEHIPVGGGAAVEEGTHNE